MGKSTGDFGASTSADFADDTNEAVDWLLTRAEADKTRIGLAGHSEGGMIAPIVAGSRHDINFIILLAGPGVPIIDLMATQRSEVSKSAGVRAAAADSFAVFYKKAIQLIIKAATKEQAIRQFTDSLDAWIAVTPKNIVFPNTGIYNDSTKKTFVNLMVQTLSTPWFRYFMQFNPQPYLAQLHCRVLALNGSRDIQVASKQNLGGLEASLKKSPSPYYEVKEIPGLNHLFQTCRKCTLQEYSELEETFSPVALTIISDWLRKNVL
jgi:pimeloyl-ACP methyl ester carboxylesterase